MVEPAVRKQAARVALSNAFPRSLSLGLLAAGCWLLFKRPSHSWSIGSTDYGGGSLESLEHPPRMVAQLEARRASRIGRWNSGRKRKSGRRMRQTRTRRDRLKEENSGELR